MTEPFFKKYTDLVPDQTDLCSMMEIQRDLFMPWLFMRTEQESLLVHAPYTWTLREVLNHLSDAERVFAFRALWIARGGKMPLSSFDEHEFARRAQANATNYKQLVNEFLTVRDASLSLFCGLSSSDWECSGQAGDYVITVRKQAEILLGHVEHHRNILQTRFN